MSLEDVYPEIVEASQVCKATVVMTSKVDPCPVEPRRPATGSYNWFSAQLAVSVALSVLVLYGHISAARTQFKQHYSGSVVAETLIIHWCHIEGCCITGCHRHWGKPEYHVRVLIETLSQLSSITQDSVDWTKTCVIQQSSASIAFNTKHVHARKFLTLYMPIPIVVLWVTWSRHVT